MTKGDFAGRCMHFATADLPLKDRLPAWRDYWGRQVFGADIEPTTDDPFSAETRVATMPGIRLLSTDISPVRLIRSAALMDDGNDCLGLVTSSCRIGTVQRGSELTLTAGDARLLSSAEPSVIESGTAGRFQCILIQRRVLSPLLSDTEAAVQRTIPADDRLLGLLFGYLGMAVDEKTTVVADFADVIASHIRDLIAIMLEPGIDREAVGSGLRAIQLAHIKRYVADNCGDPSLSIHHVAARMGLSTRYIQRLLARQGTTFTDYLLDRRLKRVSRSLLAPADADRTVADLAFDAGFGDVSHFNRCFKRRFGLSPKDFRQAHRP